MGNSKLTYEELEKKVLEQELLINQQKSLSIKDNPFLSEGGDMSEEQTRMWVESLQQQVLDLQQMNVSKDKFLSLIAHDLRNPFVSIIGLSDLLVKNSGKYDLEKIQKYISCINQSASEAFRLLENLLEWSRLKQGTVKPLFKNHSLSQLISDVLLHNADFALRKQISLQNLTGNDLNAYCDDRMTRSVLQNLILNSIKFTNQNGMVTIFAFQQNGSIEIHVQDTGVGIAKETLPLLFRIDNNVSSLGTNGEKGTGMGLILCKELVEKQGGKIWCESTPNIGSLFCFTLQETNL